MTLRTKLSLIIGGGALLILLLILFALFAGRRAPENEELVPLEPSPASAPVALPPAAEPIPTTPIVLRTTEAAFDLEAFVKSFVERFGSFSNASNYENIEELREFMTPRMVLWAEQFVADARAKSSGDAEYYGMTTRALTIRSLTQEEGKGVGTIVVTTQRREVHGIGTPRVFYQDAALELRKIGEEWKVESVGWK